MSKKWQKKLTKVLEDPNYYHEFMCLMEKHFPNKCAVCAYKGTEREEFRYGIVVDVDFVFDHYGENGWFVHFINKKGIVEEFCLNLEDVEYATNEYFFGDMDDNLKVLKQCENMVDAFQYLEQVLRDGKKVLEEI